MSNPKQSEPSIFDKVPKDILSDNGYPLRHFVGRVSMSPYTTTRDGAEKKTIDIVIALPSAVSHRPDGTKATVDQNRTVTVAKWDDESLWNEAKKVQRDAKIEVVVEDRARLGTFTRKRNPLPDGTPQGDFSERINAGTYRIVALRILSGAPATS